MPFDSDAAERKARTGKLRIRSELSTPPSTAPARRTHFSDVVAALITAAAALAVSLVSLPRNYLINHLANRAQTLDLMGHYRDPLLWSVHDLRSRVRAILDEDFLGRYLVEADDTILADGDKLEFAMLMPLTARDRLRPETASGPAQPTAVPGQWLTISLTLSSPTGRVLQLMALSPGSPASTAGCR